MINSLNTVHIKYKNLFYFLLQEKIGIPVFSIWMAFLLSLTLLVERELFDGSVSLSFYLTLVVIVLFMLAFMTIFTFIPAYYRGKFLRREGYCTITPEYIESVCCGKKKKHEYKNRSIKTKTYKDGSVDIFIGKSFLDVIKHGSFIFTPKFFIAYKALIGFGSPLYRVTNADEVISFLKANQ